MKAIKNCFGRLAVGLVLAACAPAPGWSTTFIPLDQQQLAEISAAAVVGTVAEIRSGRDAQDGEIRTDIHISVEEVLFGEVLDGSVVVREPGGRVGGDEEWIYGAPRFQLGERVLVFLSSQADGTYRTTALGLGKFTVRSGRGEVLELVREFGDGVQILDPSGELIADPDPEVTTLADAVREQRHARRDTRRSPEIVPPSELLVAENRSEFTYLGSAPARWFESDSGDAVLFKIDYTGDPGPELGPAQSVAAIDDAFDAWSSVSGSAFQMVDDGPLSELLTFAGCSGGNRIVFNDPFNEITDPSGCGGVLAVGGYCTSSETRTVNGTLFRRIRVGKVTFNNGWSGCGGWNRCNLSEVATHEIGHAIGLGHSPESNAIMRSFAYFNGRCTTLGSDDEAAMRFMYPGVVLNATPSPTAIPQTATPTRTPVPNTPTPTRTTVPNTPTPTRTTVPNTPTPTRTLTPTPRATDTPTPVPTSTRTFTPTFTRTFSSTPTAVPNTPTPSGRRLAGRVRYFMDGGGVPGVEVRLSGASSLTGNTGFEGDFDFDQVAGGGSLEVRGAKDGDEGAAISALDAAYALQAVVGARQLTALQHLACDATGDGTISPLDASRLLQLAIGALPALPVAERCGSSWLLVPASESQGIAVPPTITSEACQPGSLTVPSLAGDMTALAFDAVLLGDCSGGWRSSMSALSRSDANARRARVRLGRLKVRGSTATMLVYVRSGAPYQSLDLDIRYDETQLEPVSVEASRVGGSKLLAQRVIRPGVLRIAFASSDPIQRRQGALLNVSFDLTRSGPLLSAVRALEARIDEATVRAVSNTAQR